MLLFLDFDGVLHPENLGEAQRDRLFCCLPLLHQILRVAPSVEVVFSTSWRLLYSRERLVLMVTKEAPELATRFVGHTPHFDARNRPQGVTGQREEEIRAWLAANKQKNRPWLALDDDAECFRPGCEELYLVDWQTGLVDEDVWAVVESLR